LERGCRARRRAFCVVIRPVEKKDPRRRTWPKKKQGARSPTTEPGGKPKHTPSQGVWGDWGKAEEKSVAGSLGEKRGGKNPVWAGGV